MNDKPRILTLSVWLLLCAGMIVVMALIGAITRLTESGLSIMVWEVFRGVIPPLSEADWQRYFQTYQRTDEFKLDNPNMDLEGFKQIFWWEWVHRFWGRLIGFVFIVPLVWFWLHSVLPSWLKRHLLAALLLGALQGFIGWYMVYSGFGERTDVSQYRLALHLAIALLLYVYLLWLVLRLNETGHTAQSTPQAARYALVTFALVSFTIISGAFVAGLNAGNLYNAFPTMGGGRLLPIEYAELKPYWRNWFDNAAAVQFNHRLLATLTVFIALFCGAFGARNSTGVVHRFFILMVFVAVLQYGLGILTLLSGVNIQLASAHQGGAIILLGLSLASWYSARNARRHSKFQ